MDSKPPTPKPDKSDIIWGMSVDESKTIFNDRADIVPMPYAVVIYVLVMVAGSIFKDRFMIWTFASFVFFAHIFRVFIRAWAWHKKHPHLKAIRKDAKTKAFQWRQKLYTVGTKVRGVWRTQNGKDSYDIIGTVVAMDIETITVECKREDADSKYFTEVEHEIPIEQFSEEKRATVKALYNKPQYLKLQRDTLYKDITEIIEPISYEDGIYDGDTPLSVYATYPDLAMEALKVKVWKGETCEGILMATTGSRDGKIETKPERGLAKYFKVTSGLVTFVVIMEFCLITTGLEHGFDFVWRMHWMAIPTYILMAWAAKR